MSAEKLALIKALRSEGSGIICQVLKKTIPFGVVYHHSGLTNAERKLIEEAFLSGTINCICCTSTLAAGINLPAQRVIIRSPYVGKSFITLSQYRQMIGRAGRAGLESSGESFLICQPSDTEKVGQLLSSKMERCYSQLHNNDFSCFVMSLISLELVKDKNSIIDVMKKSLLYMQSQLLGISIEQYIQDTLDLLLSNGVIEMYDEKFILKSFGKAAVKGNLPFEVARELYEDLIQAQKSLVLVNDLHLLYLVTPYSILEEVHPTFDVIWNVFSEMNSKNMQVARTVGINEAIVHRILAQRSLKTLPEKILKRFFISLILNELWTGQNVWSVSKKYKLSRGFVYNLLSTSSSFASSVIRFCEVMVELKCFVNLLGNFPQQLGFCCSPELLPLLELPAVNKGRAKLLFNAGFKDLRMIANSDPETLANSVYYLPIKHAKKIIEGAKLLQLITFETLQDEVECLREGIGV
ncbi:helicase POLQ-like [Halyomorpha halys]|uniref:helicase POLQ-like n=1 Tax=Halyomorpha halys TaxID=286706 RepID=UPI0034D371B7